MARPQLGTKRLCPNCGAKYYDLDRDPIVCPKCHAAFATGVIAARPETANTDDDELETDDDAVELVALEEADEDATESTDGEDDIDAGDDVDVDVDVDADDAALIDDDDDDEVSDVVRPADDDDDDR